MVSLSWFCGIHISSRLRNSISVGCDKPVASLYQTHTVLHCTAKEEHRVFNPGQPCRMMQRTTCYVTPRMLLQQKCPLHCVDIQNGHKMPQAAACRHHCTAMSGGRPCVLGLKCFMNIPDCAVSNTVQLTGLIFTHTVDLSRPMHRCTEHENLISNSCKVCYVQSVNQDIYTT